VTRVAIDARIPQGITGGIAQVVIGLAQGFAEAKPEGLERTWLVYPDYQEWLGPHLPSDDEKVVCQGRADRAAVALSKRFPRLASTARPYAERVLDSLPSSRRKEGPFDGLFASRGIEVVHVPFQDGLATRVPTVYHPHDLQHRYLPEYFSHAQIAHRERVWRSKALRAYAVSVGTESVANDVCRFWGVPCDRVHVIPLAPVNSGVEVTRDTRTVSDRSTILYPAAFWPHKNHVVLVKAVELLQQQGVRVDLVLPGAAVGVYGDVRREVVECGLDVARTLPGYVTAEALSQLFADATVLAVPSRFESASFPIWEAFRRGIPVVAARTTSLPRQVGNGGVIVGPDDPKEWADALRTLLDDESLRSTLGSAGKAHVADFTWERTALASAALYRRAAGSPPVEEEEEELNAPARL